MLTKEKLESWYEPKKLEVSCECLTEKEELTAEEVDVCEMCNGTGEVPVFYQDESTGYNWVEDGTKPCICQSND